MRSTPYKYSIIYLLMIFGVLLLIPSGDSLWIDESRTWVYTQQATFFDFLKFIFVDHNSEAQMPLGMLSFWGISKMIGSSEWALRSINILWGIGTILCLYHTSRRTKIFILPLLMVIQPFFWYYGNEARPYGMQIFAGSVLLMAMIEWVSHPHKHRQWIYLWGIGSILALGISMLGGILVAVCTLIMVLGVWRRKIQFQRKEIIQIIMVFGILTLFSIYYFLTLFRGVGGAKLWEPSWANLAFSGLEFIGVQGFLPPRYLLREMAKGYMGASLSLWDLKIGIMGMGCIMSAGAVLLFYGWRYRRPYPPFIPVVAVTLFSSCILLFIATKIVGFPFWGRHLAPVFPFYVFFVGWLATTAWKHGSRVSRGILLLGALAILTSSILLRFLPFHQKDDYRGAAILAMDMLAKGGVVWWAADIPTGEYYHLPFTSQDANLKIYDAGNKRSNFYNDMIHPDLVVMSKVDLFDLTGDLRRWLTENNFIKTRSLRAFSVWAKITKKQRKDITKEGTKDTKFPLE